MPQHRLKDRHGRLQRLAIALPTIDTTRRDRLDDLGITGCRDVALLFRTCFRVEQGLRIDESEKRSQSFGLQPWFGNQCLVAGHEHLWLEQLDVM